MNKDTIANIMFWLQNIITVAMAYYYATNEFLWVSPWIIGICAVVSEILVLYFANNHWMGLLLYLGSTFALGFLLKFPPIGWTVFYIAWIVALIWLSQKTPAENDTESSDSEEEATDFETPEESEADVIEDGKDKEIVTSEPLIIPKADVPTTAQAAKDENMLLIEEMENDPEYAMKLAQLKLDFYKKQNENLMKQLEIAKRIINDDDYDDEDSSYGFSGSSGNSGKSSSSGGWFSSSKSDFEKGREEGWRDSYLFGDDYKFDSGRIGGSQSYRDGYEAGHMEGDEHDW